MKFQTRITAGSIFMLALFVIVCIYGFIVLGDFRTIENDQANTVELIQVTGELNSLLHEIEASVRNYMLTGKNEYLIPYKELQHKYSIQTDKALEIAKSIHLDTVLLSEAHTHLKQWYTQEAEPSIMDRKRLDMTPAERAKSSGTNNAVKVAQVLSPEVLRQFQHLFYKMTGLANLVVELDGAAVKEQSFDEFSTFCFGLVRATKKGAARCTANDVKGGQVAMKTGKPYAYTCHAGLVDFAVPIIVDGVQIGAWLGGQVLTKQPNIEEFKKIAADLGIEEEAMLQAVQQIPVLEPERVESAAKFLQLLANSQSEVGNTNLMWSKIIKRLDSGVGKKILDEAGEKLFTFVNGLKELRNNDQAKMDSSLKRFKILLWSGLIIFTTVSIVILYLNRMTIRNQIGGDPKIIAGIANKIATGADSLHFEDNDRATGIYLAIIKMHQQLQETFANMEVERERAENRARAAQQAEEAANKARLEAEQAKRDGMLTAAQTVGDIVLRVSSAAQQLSKQIDESSRGAAQQQDRATSTAVAMNEMNATVTEVAKNASLAAADAENARERATSGNETVLQVASVIKAINERFSLQETELNDLSGRVEGIDSIMTVISDIADQTNLLALNAAIEAARAGEAGRGFAVVADEVRKLAEKTMHATAEVTSAVTAITEATARNVENMHSMRLEVESSITMANTAQTVLEDILTISDKNYTQAQNIATASEQQAHTTEEIARSIELVNQTSQETASAMVEATQAVSELASLSVELENLVQDMKAA